VLSKLGEGGMGAVFKAHDAGLDRMVAIKILPPSLAREDTYRERFLREARALARVKHQNLVQVYSVAVEKGLHFFSMEYIEGESLQQRIRRAGPMLLEQMLAVSGQVLAALRAIHREGITHRDIKSSNIMIDRKGRAVLMDLGLAKDKDSTGVTTAGVIIGTPEFMAPEQAMGEPAGPLSDIYSFGIVLYEMSRGLVPFRGKSAVAVLRHQCETEPESIAAVRPDLPREFVEAVQAAMKKSPADRPQGAADLAELLLKCGETPELKALASSPESSRNPLSGAPTVADKSLHTAPTIAGARPSSPQPTQVTSPQASPAAARAPLWRRPWFFIGLAVFLVIFAGMIQAGRVSRRRAREGASVQKPEPRQRHVTVYVGGENYFPGRKVVLIEGGITETHVTIRLDDGTTRAIPLASKPEFRYETEPEK
jgi:serine/threonine-protein kinase